MGVAGQNKVLKANEVLFNIGDHADAMYIVRKGTLRVFFPKGGEEVTVATLKDGAIVGEMAFFDDKPRSASVKAQDDTEVTIISKADFEKLLTQVPKWIVTMMQSLVGRLRQANERLQTLEAAGSQPGGGAPAASAGAKGTGSTILPNQKHAYQHAHRALKFIMLALAKDGEKEGKDVLVQKEYPLKLWRELLGEDDGLFEKTLSTLQNAKMVSLKPNQQRIACIWFSNRGLLVNFIEFFGKTAPLFKPLSPFLSPACMEMFAGMVDEVANSGYEQLNINLTTFMGAQKAKGIDVAEWPRAMAELMAVLPDIKVTKSGNDIVVKIVLKDHRLALSHLRCIDLFYQAHLA
jgi:CRP-like cAMP-binding protein